MGTLKVLVVYLDKFLGCPEYFGIFGSMFYLSTNFWLL